MTGLTFRYGSMGAAKTAHLLTVAFNFEEGGHKVERFTAALDNRFAVGQITSRIGLSAPAKVFDSSTDFTVELEKVGKVECVVIDECNWLTKDQVVSLHQFAHRTETTVLAYGLRADFQGVPFTGAAWLLALADSIEEIQSVCVCGGKASMNARFSETGIRERSGDTLLIGGNSRYRAMCPKCFYEV